MLFELFPYPMHIVITFLTPSTFYITSKNQRPVTSTSGKSGRSEVDAVYANYTIEVQKKITHPGRCPRHVGRNYVPLLCGVDTDLRQYVIRDVIVI